MNRPKLVSLVLLLALIQYSPSSWGRGFCQDAFFTKSSAAQPAKSVTISYGPHSGKRTKTEQPSAVPGHLARHTVELEAAIWGANRGSISPERVIKKLLDLEQRFVEVDAPLKLASLHKGNLRSLALLVENGLSNVPLETALKAIRALDAIGAQVNFKMFKTLGSMLQRESGESFQKLVPLAAEVMEVFAKISTNKNRLTLEPAVYDRLVSALINQFAPQSLKADWTQSEKLFRALYHIGRLSGDRIKFGDHTDRIALAAEVYLPHIEKSELSIFMAVLKRHRVLLSEKGEEILLNKYLAIIKKGDGWLREEIGFRELPWVFETVPAEFLDKVGRSYLREVGASNIPPSQMLWILLMLDPHKAYEIASRFDKRVIQRISFSGVDINQIKFINAYFKYVLGKNLPWMDNWLKDGSSKLKPSPSNGQKKAYKTIVKLARGHKVLQEYYVEEAGLFLDFYIPTMGKVVVEFDGPFHFQWNKTEQRRLIKDVRRDELLTAMKYDVHHVTPEELENFEL